MIIPIEVFSYSGYREQEKPRAFTLPGGKTVTVYKILEQQLVELSPGGDRRRCFKLLGSDRITRRIYYDTAGDRWFLESPADAGPPSSGSGQQVRPD